MKLYEYICTECETTKEYEAKSMKDDLPKKLKCPKCEKMTMVYNWNQVKGSKTVIPEHMRSTATDRMNYEKMPSHLKTYR